MSNPWYTVERVTVANGDAFPGSYVAIAVGDGKYGGGLRLGIVEVIEAQDYTARHLREWVDVSDPRPTVQLYSGGTYGLNAKGQKLVAKPDEVRQNYRLKVHVLNDCGRAKSYRKTFEYPQRIAALPHITATELEAA